MPNIFDPRNLHRLDNPERRALIPPTETLEKLGLKEGNVFVDIGAGTGYFSLPAAEITGPTGQVTATDLSPEMLEALQVNAREAGISVKTLLTPPDSVPLPDDYADMTFMALVFHEIDDRHSYLCELRRITKPAGKLVIIDWAKVDSPMGPPADHRVDFEEAKKIISTAGFDLESAGMINPYQYYAVAKPA